jgi:hypothetical protein
MATTTSIPSTPVAIPYCREKQISFSVSNLLFNTELDAWLDEYRVTRLIRRPNTIKVTNTSGKFKVGDTVGYKPTSSTFIGVGTVIDVYKEESGSMYNMTLYIIDDLENVPTNLAVGGTLYNGFFDSSGSYYSSSDSGTISALEHLSGKIATSGSVTTTVTLNGRASSVTDYYVGQTFNIVTVSAKTSTDTLHSDEVDVDYPIITITAYNGSTKVATLSSAVSVIAGVTVYSIGKPRSNEIGKCSGVFYMRGGVFPTGKRIFRLDNRYVSVNAGQLTHRPGTETTYATATYFASGVTQKATDSEFSAGTGSSTSTSSQGTTALSTPIAKSAPVVASVDYIPCTDVHYGGGCPDPDTLIFMPDFLWVRAGDLNVGDSILTIHEHTRDPGTFKILEAERIVQPKVEIEFANGQKLKVSTTHKFLMSDDTWKKVCDISVGEAVMGMNYDVIYDLSSKEIVSITDIGEGEVIKFEIEDAHTYITEGLVSHNQKAVIDTNVVLA